MIALDSGVACELRVPIGAHRARCIEREATRPYGAPSNRIDDRGDSGDTEAGVPLDEANAVIDGCSGNADRLFKSPPFLAVRAPISRKVRE